MIGRGRRGANETGKETLKTVILASLIAGLLACAAGLVAAAKTIDLGPRIGDILVFKPGARLPTDWEFAAVTQSSQLPVSCKLRPDIMASGGGSLVVERRSDNRRVFTVHWAGEHTSDEMSDCGNTADLVVSRLDLQLLSNAIGGPGVERKRFPWF